MSRPFDINDWYEDPWKAATGMSDIDRWENEGGALNRLLAVLTDELDSIGQYAETEGVDWCKGASQTLQGVINYIKTELTDDPWDGRL